MNILPLFLLIVGKLLCSSFDDFMPLSQEEMEQIAQETAYRYFHPESAQKKKIVQPKITVNPVFVQKKVRSLLPDEKIENIVREGNRLFLSFDDYGQHRIYEYLQTSKGLRLEKSFFIEDSTCTKPALNGRHLALYCHHKQNLYLLDLKTYHSRSIHLANDVSDLLWHGDQLITAQPGPRFTWFDSNLTIIDTLRYPYARFPLQVRMNSSKKMCENAGVRMRKSDNAILAVSRYFSLLLHVDTKEVLHTAVNFLPLGLDENRTWHTYHSWNDYFRNNRRYGFFTSTDDFWLVSVGSKYYANILQGNRLIMWQWPQEKESFESNIVIYTYDPQKEKIEQDFVKKTSPKFVGTLQNNKGTPIALFYTSKGFWPVVYDPRLIFSTPKGYIAYKDITPLGFYEQNDRHLAVYVQKGDEDNPDLGLIDFSLRNGHLSVQYEASLIAPRDKAIGYVRVDTDAYLLTKRYIAKLQNHKIVKKASIGMTHPWGLKKCQNMTAIYGTGKGYGLELLDNNLHRILVKYPENSVKDIACSNQAVIIATDSAVEITSDLKKKTKVVEDLSRFPDDCMAVGFVKKSPFYVVSRKRQNLLVILDKSRKELTLDFFATRAETKGSAIALGDGKDIALVAYASEPKIVSRWKGALVGWWKDGIVYLNKDAIYLYDTATKKHNKLLDFDPRKWQGKMTQTYVDKDSLVFVMSDMYRIVIDLNTKKIQMDILQ